jgi:hypothetical protein
VKGNKYGAYTTFTRQDLLAKIDELERALAYAESKNNKKCNCGQNERIIRNIADYAKLPLKYRTPNNCGRVF